MDYLSIVPHNRITALEDELPCKPSQTSGVCVHLKPIYVFNVSPLAVRDRMPPSAIQHGQRARLTDRQNRKY